MDVTRRSFLLLSGGAGAAAATVAGRKVVNRLIPYVTPPEKIPPGTWAHYATACRECPAGCGMVLMHRDGRVTKAEGNPLHPVGKGGLCARGQSALQGLYDPDRLQTPLVQENGKLRPTNWDTALEQAAARLKNPRKRLTILSDLQNGALAEVYASFAAAFGGKVLLYEPFSLEPVRRAHAEIYGSATVPRYRLEECDFILSFAADFLETWGSTVEYARSFSEMRSYRGGKVGRFAYVGPRLSMTAANADEFYKVSPNAIRWSALAVLWAMLNKGWGSANQGEVRPLAAALGGAKAQKESGLDAATVTRLAERFAKGKATVALAGPAGATDRDAEETALAVALLNHAAGRNGRQIDFGSPHALSACATSSEIAAFLDSISEDDVVIVVNADPAHTIPGASDKLARAGYLLSISSLPHGTAELSCAVFPTDTPPESWGDYDPYPGVHTLMQPAMARLYDSRSIGDIIMGLATKAGKPLKRTGAAAPEKDFESWVLSRWKAIHASGGPGNSFDDFWRSARLNGGFFNERQPSADPFRPKAIPPFSPSPPMSREEKQLDLWLAPSIFLYDGRTANRGWIQEAPDPITTIVWGSWIELHPATAQRLGLREGEVAEMTTRRGSISAPVALNKDMVEGTAAIPTGQGQAAAGLSVARGVGANAFILGREGDGPFGTVRVAGTGRRIALIRVTAGQSFDPVRESAARRQFGREILQTVKLSELRRMKPGEGEEIRLPLPEGYDPKKDLYKSHSHTGHRWGMIVDLQRCIGCGACAVACYAENNLAVMGPDQVAKGREMAWLKVVPYRHEENPARLSWLPMLCQHCDAAPCEPVCPVFAAVHNEEGLNAQVYNRCIGTRYCSNNCPYKVRRFNWLNVYWKPPLDLQLNPDVTVRCRGVMEKCTFCVQRIRSAEYTAKVENRPLKEGEIQPACVQSCPAGVYTFGDMMAPDSVILRTTLDDPRRYQVLEDLNTKPAITYLRRIVTDI